MRRSGLLVFLFLSCPPAPRPCTPITCEGCCTFSSPDDPGTCEPGDLEAACGRGGMACERCITGEACSSFRVCRGPDEPLPSGAKVVFASSQTFTGKLGGVSGADRHCQALAADAGHSGRFLAWLSDATDAGVRLPAIERFTGNGPWVLLTRDARGKVLQPFANRDALRGPPRSPIDQDEHGTVLVLGDKRQAWTGTLLDGGVELPLTDRDTLCERWTSERTTGLYGVIDVPTDKWSGLAAITCASDNRLYCFEQ